MTALADGVPWTGLFVSGSTSAGLSGFPGLVTVSGSDRSGLFLSIAGPLAVGGHDLDGPSYVTFDLSQGLALRWSANKIFGLGRGLGSLIITTATPTRVAGRFSFTAVTTTGASPETRTVTNGVFELSQ